MPTLCCTFLVIAIEFQYIGVASFQLTVGSARRVSPAIVVRIFLSISVVPNDVFALLVFFFAAG